MSRASAAALWAIERHPVALGLVFLACAIGALAKGDFRVGHSYEDWIDPSDGAYRDYQAMRATFHDADTIVAAFDRAALTPDRLADYYALLDRLRDMDGVLNVFDPAELFLGADAETMPDTASIEELRAALARQPANYRNVLVSADVDTLCPLILVDPARRDTHAAVLQAAQAGFSALGLHPQLAGTVVFSEALKAAIASDLVRVVVLLTLTSTLLLMFFFRDALAIAIVFVGIALSTLYSFAITGVFDLSINLLTLLLAPLVFCISVTTAIHLFARREAGRWTLRQAYPQVLAPLAISTITSAIGCLVFASAPQAIVARMGLVMPAAVIITFFTSMLLVPALLASSGRLERLPIVHHRTWLPGPRVRRALCVGVLALCAAAAVSVPRLTRDPDAFAFFAEDSALVRAYRAIEQRVSGLLVADLVIRATDGQSVMTGRHRDDIEALLADLRGIPDLTTIVSGFDLLRTPGALEGVPGELGSAFFSKDHAAARVSLRFRNADARPYAAMAHDVETRWGAHAPVGLAMRLTGVIPLILDAQDRLLKTQSLTLVAGLLVVCVLLVPFFRTPGLTLLSAITIFVPLLITAGSMVWLAIPINSINLFVGGVILGLVVDDAIYLLHAYRRSGDIQATLDEVGGALSMTTLAIGLAFATLAWSQLVPIRQFGLLSVITVLSAWSCDLCVVPTLIEWFGQKR